jgi:hypothetical protein
MNRQSIIILVTLFVLVVAGMFIFANLKKSEIVTPEPSIMVEEETSPYANITRVDAKHYFIDGTHTFVGEVAMPTPCDLLEVQSIIMESYPEKISLDFTVVNTSDTCAQVITNHRFMASATASEEASISATFMGRDIELNLIPAGVGETPDEFEVFIKG